jgi:hypothetical protein
MMIAASFKSEDNLKHSQSAVFLGGNADSGVD